MKKILIGLGLAIAAFAASAQVSVSVGGRLAPGVYGSVNIGDYGQPAVVYQQPQVIVRDRSYVDDPVYIYVPDYQQRDWRRYCWQYQSCNRPVYFIQETWVQQNWQQRQWRQRNWQQRQWQERQEQQRQWQWQQEQREHRQWQEQRRDDRHDRDGDHGRDHDRDHGEGHDKH